jgi:peptidyl-prolyl cis-trans isomerase C
VGAAVASLAWWGIAAGARFARADAGASELRRSAVVAKVGAIRTVTVGDVEDAIVRIPRFQRDALGATGASVRDGVLSDVLVPALLYELAAEEAHVEARPSVGRALDWARSGAMIRAIRSEVARSNPVSADDVRAYYQAHLDRFEAPQRLRIFRILCETRDEAAQVLEAANADPTPKGFAALARDHSIDKATNLRGGDLGFLDLEGVSADPDVRIDRAVVRAADHVRDGSFVPVPVPEGGRYAVVWRRGTLAATHRDPSDEAVASSIRVAILDERIRQATSDLLARLRAARVRDVDAGPLRSIDAPSAPMRDAALGTPGAPTP